MTLIHGGRSKIRKNGNGYQLTFPKYLGDMLELLGNEVIEWQITVFDDGSVECFGNMLFDE